MPASVSATFSQGARSLANDNPGRLRVLVVVHGYPPRQAGGAERRAERTVRALHERGIPVAVLCVDGIDGMGAAVRWFDERQDGITIRHVTLGREAAAEGFRRSYDNPQVEAALAGLVAAWRPTILHQFSGYLTTARVVEVAAACRLPIVVSLTDYWWLCHRVILVTSGGRRCQGPEPVACARCQAESCRRFWWLATACPRLADAFWGLARRVPALGARIGVPDQERRAAATLQALRQVDALIAPSRYLADVYTRLGIDPGRVVVTRQGVEPPRDLTRYAADELRFGYLGQIKPHKGVDLLLDAWSRLTGPHPRRLCLHGSDRGAEVYGRQIRRAAERFPSVQWGGEFDHGAVWSVLADLDVLVVPSRWVENSPNVILEGQAMGLPIVASNLGALPELVTHGENGLLFRPNDADDLAWQLQRLLDEPGLAGHLGNQARPVATVEHEVSELIGIYERLLAARSSRGPVRRASMPAPRASTG